LISTSQDFDTALDFVLEEQDTFNRKIDNKMNADDFNSIFREIEDNINNLYEKIRVLEDIKNYTREFVTRTIEERRKKIINSLKVIEKSVDEFQNNDYVATVVGFDNNPKEIKDRDGSVISSLQLMNNKLNTPSKNLSVESLVSLTNLGQQKDVPNAEGELKPVPFASAEPFADSRLGVMETPGQYRSIYESDQPVEDGIDVEYEIAFGSRAACNFFTVNPINCTVKKITLTDFEGQTKSIDPDNEYFHPAMDIQRANIVINCSNYERIRLNVPSAPQQDAFDKSIVGSEMNG